ncbi:MAG: hypothetical protein KJ042_02785 [Deltaproteobacteria bacterium]|nr:hypothetical protein [Deltaproteobacteria bacterium]
MVSYAKLGRMRAGGAARPAFRLEILKFLCIAAVLAGLSGCADDGADSAVANTDSPLYIECFEGETAATETSAQQLPPKAKGEEGSSDFPEGLPACPPFDDTMFFETPPNEVFEQFAEAVFPAKSIPCTVFLDGGEAQLDCPLGPSVALAWTWPVGHFPFDDGDVVRLYMEYGMDDPAKLALAIFDLDVRLLMLAVPSSFFFNTSEIDCVEVDANVNISYVDGYTCEYDLDDAPPIAWPDPSEPDCCHWTRVFGLSGSGHIDEIEWTLNYPGDISTSDDGGYYVSLPVNYSGDVYDEEMPDFANIKQEFALQIVRRWD